MGCCGQGNKSSSTSSISSQSTSMNGDMVFKETRISTTVVVLAQVNMPKMPSNAKYSTKGRQYLNVYKKDLDTILSVTDENGNPAFATKEQYEAMQNGGDSVEFAVQVESAESPPITVNFAEFKGISEKTSDILNDAGYTLETLKAADEDELIELGLKSRQAKIAISAVNKDGE